MRASHRWSNRRGRKTHSRSRRRRSLAARRRTLVRDSLGRIPFQRLETRHLLAAVSWDGGGDGVRWHDPLNWDHDAVPTASDEVVIRDANAELVVRLNEAAVAASVDSTESLRLVGGDLRTASLLAENLRLDTARISPLDVEGSVSVRLTGDLAITGGESEFLIFGNVRVDGDLNAEPGVQLRAAGADAQLAVAGAAVIDGVSLFATAGGEISLPGATSYAHVSDANGQHRRIEADGTGSRIDLNGVTSIRGGTHYRSRLSILARAGGMVDLASTREIIDPTEGNTRQRSIGLEASGDGSQIVLASLETFIDRDVARHFVFDAGLHSRLVAAAGGSIHADLLTEIRGVELIAGGEGSVTTSQLAAAASSRLRFSDDDRVFPSLTDGNGTEVTADGVRLEFPVLESLRGGGLTLQAGGTFEAERLSDIDGASFAVADGVTLRLPAASQYRHASTANRQTRSWVVDGPGSLLDLGQLTRVVGGTHLGSQLQIESTGGGRIDLGGVSEIVDGPDGDPRQRAVTVLVEGSGSEIALDSLRHFQDSDVDEHFGFDAGLHSRLTATAGASVAFSPEGLRIDGVVATAGGGGRLAGPLDVSGRSRLEGSGTIGGNVVLAGTINPAADLTLLGSLQQQPNGVLEFDIGGLDPGTGHDLLSVAGDVDFGGTVRLLRKGSYAPEEGDRFDLMEFGARTGIPTYDGLDFGGDTALSPELSSEALSVVSGFSPGPRVVSVIASDGGGEPDAPYLDVTFSEPIDPATFSSDRITLVGPDGSAEFAEPVGLPDQPRVFRISIPREGFVDGEYTLSFGPDVLDLVSNAMNQDGDEINGEPVDDRYTGDLLIELARAPDVDLVAGEVTAPDRVIGDPGEMAVEWTVTHAGTSPAARSGWSDAVVVSANDIYGDSDDIELARYANVTPLASGESYQRTEHVTLPPALSGRFHLFVAADVGATVDESGAEDNNVSASATRIDVMPAPYADLVVDSIAAPDNAVAGEEMTIGWEVLNQGIGITTRGDWVDRVLLARDAEGSELVADSESLFTRYGQLAPGGRYDRGGWIIVPHGLSGDFFLVVETAYQRGPFEFVFGENNTTVSSAVPITVSPSPDLVVSSVEAPTEAEEGASMDVRWTVANRGAAAAEGRWHDRVFLTAAGDPDAEPIVLGQFEFRDAVAVGDRYSRSETVRIPERIRGPFELFVETDSGGTLYENNAEANNVFSAGAAVDVRVQPRPDLQADSIVVPDRVVAGGTLSGEFEIRNHGLAGTEDRTWVDRAYLSLDTQIDPGDIVIGAYGNASALSPDDHYRTVTGTIDVPLRFRGDVYLLIHTDAEDDVPEWPGNENNVSYQSVFVEAAPLSDLVVSNVVVPAQAVAGASLPIRYTVTNLGASATHGDTWTEGVWLTRDKDRPHPGQGDVLLRSLTHSGGLDRFAGTDRSAEVAIPATIESGTWYLTPWVDSLDAIPEDTLAANVNPDDPGETDNNNYKAAEILVVGSQPDLVVADVTAPATATGGETMDVTWTVENRGFSDAPGGWLDRVYLSDRPDPHADGANTTLLGRRRRHPRLAAGSSYTASLTVQLSPSASGQYLVVVTDDEAEAPASVELPGFFGGLLPSQPEPQPVREFDERNNATAAEVNVSGSPANLRVVDIELPEQVDSGEEVIVRYTVENVGSHPVWRGTRTWRDFLWLTADDSFIRQRASFLGEVIHTPEQALEPGNRLTVETSVTIPEGTAGGYTLFVHLNAHNERSPLFFPYTSRILLEDWYPAATGSNEIWTQHFQRWAFETPGDNLAEATLQVVPREADLRVTALDVPATARSGETIPVTISVTNDGTRATRVSRWTDRLFLSRDTSLGRTDLELRAFSQLGSLAAGASYTETVNVRLPDGIDGDFHLIAMTDSAAMRDRARRPSDIGFDLVGIEFELPGSLAPWDLASAASRESAGRRSRIPARREQRRCCPVADKPERCPRFASHEFGRARTGEPGSGDRVVLHGDQRRRGHGRGTGSLGRPGLPFARRTTRPRQRRLPRIARARGGTCRRRFVHAYDSRFTPQRSAGTLLRVRDHRPRSRVRRGCGVRSRRGTEQRSQQRRSLGDRVAAAGGSAGDVGRVARRGRGG